MSALCMNRGIGMQILFAESRSLVFQVTDAGADYSTETYEVWLNGIYRFTSCKTVETIYNLEPDTLYGIQLRRGGVCSEEAAVCTKKEFAVLNVKDFGARGDGVSDETAYIQAAILTCPPGSRVRIPAGVFRFTNLFLKSDITLEIAKDAVLSAIPDSSRLPVLPGRIACSDGKGEFLPASWEGEPVDSYTGILTGMYVENVVICGQGVLEGNADFENWWTQGKLRGTPARPRMMFFNHCKNIVVQGITVRNAPAWNLHPYFSEHLQFYDLHIESPEGSCNTDGLNPESCRDVQIAGVFFSVGDDCIAVKSGKLYMGKTYKTPSRDILIHNCLMEKGHGGVTIGSEIGAGVDNIVVRNCRFVNTDRGLRVKTRRGRGEDSRLRGIVFDGVTMEGVPTPFVINCFYYCDPDGKSDYVSSKEKLPVDERTPGVGDIVIRNVSCRDCHVAGVYFYGLPEAPIESIRMENVRIAFAENTSEGMAAMMSGCEKCSRKGIFIRNAEKAVLINVELSGYEGEALDIENVDKWEWLEKAPDTERENHVSGRAYGNKYHGSLKGMLAKYDRYARGDAFRGNSLDEFRMWQNREREILGKLIGLGYMEKCPLNPVIEETKKVENGIIREKVILQVEPETYMPVYILIPEGGGRKPCFIAFPGHMSGGKYSVAGCYDIPAVREKIDLFHYDYGMRLARMGYVALCPDCRGFGERRDEAMQGDSDAHVTGSTCFQLSHMAEPLGETVIGMFVWDAMRLIDYIFERDEWDTGLLGCIGFSGGGMQALWTSALDERVRQAVISGYLYGYRDSLLTLNGNCSCNYVPHLFEHVDMGDIGSLIAPRPLLIQSCREDSLNGPRGMANVREQTAIVREAYERYGKGHLLIHDVRQGGHCFHPEPLENALACFRQSLVHGNHAMAPDGRCAVGDGAVRTDRE